MGEGSWPGPSRYLGAVLKRIRAHVDRRFDRQPITGAFLSRGYDAFILSDYRHAGFSRKTEGWVCDQVRAGAGLLMIGGWASFTGLVGGYAGSRVESLLPVRCVPGDDRVNWAGGTVMLKEADHSSVRGLDWSSPPVLCGYHRVKPRPGSRTIVGLREIRWKRGKPVLGEVRPLLTLGAAGRGRTAAFMTDCAPHWCGGLVDWGRRRVTVPVARGVSVEVGEQYLLFFERMVRWVLPRQALRT